VLEFPRWKVWIVSLVVALGVLFSIPSLIAGTTLASRWPSWLPHEKISLGLDLAGGSHLLLEADANDALKQRLQAKEDEVSTELRRDPRIEIGDISTAGGRLSFLVRDPTQVDAAVERLRKLSQPLALTGNRDWDVQVVDQTRVVLIPTPGGTVKALKDAMSVARDVVRRRIDPGGTKEITVITEGADRILVQVPGVENPEQLKKLIGQTARLEFKLVDMEANPADVQQGDRGQAASHGLGRSADQGFAGLRPGRPARHQYRFRHRGRSPLRASDAGECRKTVRDHP
jgi:preprotein translocase subunit SecD